MMRREDRLFDRFRRTGDPSALAGVFDRCSRELLRVATYLTGNVATAEDLVQEAFLQAIRRVAEFEGGRPVRPWLLGILANLAHKQRRDARRIPDAQRLGELSPENPLDSASRKEFQAALKAALERVPDTYRQVLFLQLEHGLTAKEIGEALGRPAGTVRS